MSHLAASSQLVVRDLMARALTRLQGVSVALDRPDITGGEFDNHFDGVVSAIFHVADAVELARTGVRRRVGEGDEATVIRSVVATLAAANVGPVPAPARLIDLNHRRNMSVHGHWTEVLDRDGLAEASAAGLAFFAAAAVYLESLGIEIAGDHSGGGSGAVVSS